MHIGYIFSRSRSWLLLIVWGALTAASAQVSVSPGDSVLVTTFDHLENPAALPFRETLQEYYALFPGMVLQNYRGTDYLHYRGSRHDEIGYTLEGADIRSSFTGQVVLNLIPEALEAITLRSSHFTADGSAPVVLQHTLKTGREGFHVSLRGESDRFTPAYTPRWGTFSYGYENLVGTVEGSFLSGDVRFFLGVEGRSLSDAARVFWDGFTIGGPGNPLLTNKWVYIPPEELEPERQGYEKYVPGAGWVGDVRYAPVPIYGRTIRILFPLEDELGTDHLVVRPGNIPESSLDQLNLNGIVTVTLNNWQLRGIVAGTRDSRQINEQPIPNIFRLDRVPVQEEQTDFLALKASYTWSPTLTAHVMAYGFDHSSHTVDPRYGDNFLFNADTLVTEGIGSNPRLYIHGFNFYRPDTEILSRYSKFDERILGLRASMDKAWAMQQLSVGVEYQSGTIRYYETRPNKLRYTLNNYYAQDGRVNIQNLTEDDLLWIRYIIDEAYGYDLWGKPIEKSDELMDGPRHPAIYTGYAAYQLELDRLILRTGLRLEGVSTGAQVFSNQSYLPYEYMWDIPIDSLTNAPVSWTLLPRISLSSRITSRLSITLSYAAHATLPQLVDIYAGRSFRTKLFGGMNFVTDLRGWDAEPVRSGHITWNMTYQPTPWLALTGQVFHNNYWRLLDADVARSGAAGTYWQWSYPLLTNKGEAVAQGIETAVLFQPGRRLQVTWIHTISSVKGTASFAGWNAGLAEYYYPSIKALPLRPLNYDQANQGNIHLSYHTPPSAPSYLRNFAVQLVYKYNGGHYTNTFPDASSG